MTETRIRVKTTLGVTDHNLLDNRFIDNQHTINAISGLEEALESKQNVLTAGENVEISEEGVISATDTTYTAGENIEISEEGVISATDTTYTAGDNVSIENGVISAVDTTYTAGENVSIENGVISAVDTTYTAGENVSIDNGVISAVDTTYTAGTGIDITNGVISNTQTSAEWGNIGGNINSQTDLKNALDAKANSADLATVATSGLYSDLSGTPTLATVATSGSYTDLSGTPTLATVATSGDYDDLSNKPTIPTITDTYSRVSHDGMSGIAVASAINSAIASVYKPAGSSTFAELPPLAAGIEGYVFNMTDDFTTTSDFVDGAGKDYPAGTNIVCILTRDGYKWDVLAGIVDLSGYQTLIDSSHKLNSDLVDDTNATNKFVTTSDKTTWNAKQDAISDLATIRAGASAGATAVQSSDLATVATTGAYSDLSGTPTIPTVNDATITITQGGVTKGSFTLNQASGDTIALEEGGSVSFDGTTINENSSNELQAVGAIDKNSGDAFGFWHGTEAQYNVGGEVKDLYYDWDNIVGNTITMPSSAAWQDIAESNGNLVAIAYESDTCAYSSDAGANWSSSTLPSTEKWNAITSGNGKFIAIDGYGKSAYTNDNGATWSAGGNLPALTNQNQNANWYGLAFGDGRFVAIDRSTGRTAYTDDNGITWVQGGDLPITGMQIAYGNGVFIVVASFTDIYAYSTDGGETWISGIMPYSGNWKSVVFGNGVFMTIDQGSGKVLTTDNGQNWTFVSVSNVGSKICYGDGIFFSYNRYGIDNITINVGYTRDNGATWNYKSFADVGNIPSFKGLVYSEDKFIGLIPNSTISYTYAINSVYTLDETPTTASTVYSTPAVTSALTITAVGTGTITLSDTNTYTYNASGNQNSYYTVGESYPNYVCNIDNVGLKIGDNDIANLASYSAFTGATGSVAGSAGLVPAPAATDNDKYLKGDGTWAAAGGSVSYDNATINENSSNELQTIGIKEVRTDTAIKIWHGTQEQWNNGGEVKDTYYNWEYMSDSKNAVTTDSFSDPNFIMVSNNNIVVGIFKSGPRKSFYTTDGITWNEVSLGYFTPYNICYDGTNFVMIGKDEKNVVVQIAKSTNGQNWNYTNINKNFYSVSGFAYYDNKYIILYGQQILTANNDFSVWNTYEGSNYLTSYKFCCGNGLILLIRSDMDDSYLYSSDGNNWQVVSKSIRAGVFANNKFYASSNSTREVYTTKDGINWTTIGTYPLSMSPGFNVVYLNNNFVTYNGNKLYLSKDYLTWRNISISSSLNGIATNIVYTNNSYIIGGYDKSVITAQINSVYTLDENPTTSSQVYSAPETTSTLTITSVGTGTITLSDTNTYTYNAGGNAYSYYTVGESYPNYLCFIDGVGVKIGTTTIISSERP